MAVVFRCFSRLKTAVAMLCVALALVSVGAVVTGVINAAEQTYDAATAHDHHLLVDVMFHDEDASADRADQAPLTGHHHHADNPSGLLISGDDVPAASIGARLKATRVSDDPTPKSGQSGPERPPKARVIRV